MDSRPSFWTRMGVEFVVVLAGVCLALLFIEWREDRADGKEALQEILADLEADSVGLAGQIRMTSRTEERVLWLLRNRDSDLPGDSIFRGTGILNYYSHYEQVTAGYEGLKGSGRLSIVRDPELRRQLIRYYENTQPYMMEFHDMYMRAHWDFSEAQAGYVRIVPDPTGEVLNQNFEFHYVRPWSEANADDLFMRRIELMGAIASQFGIRLEPALASNAELRAAIQEALG